MKKKGQQKNHLHLLAFVSLLTLINVALLVFFSPHSIVYQKEIGDTGFGTPYPPTNLSATANSSTQITITWQPGPSGEFFTPTSFVVYRTVGNNLDFTNASPYGTALSYETSYVDTGLTPGVLYNYKVAARNGSLESANSNLASATTPSLAPGKPAGVVAIATAHNQTQISWDAVSGATLYRVFRKQNEPAFVEQGSGATNSFIDNTVVGNTSYVYYVVAENNSGVGPTSDIVNVTTPSEPSSQPPSSGGDTVPPVISNIAVVPETTQAKISWQTNEITSGEVRYGTSQSLVAQASSVVQGQDHQVVVTGLEPETVYSFKIIATGISGNKSEYDGQPFTTKAVITPLQPPANFRASTSSSQIALKWTNPVHQNFRGVKIVRAAGRQPQTGTDGVVVFQGVGEETIDTAVFPDTMYYYSAYSFDDTGSVSVPVTISAQIPRSITPVAPLTPTTTPLVPVITPSSTTSPATCNPAAPDCAKAVCSSHPQCRKIQPVVSPMVSSTFPLEAITFFTSDRELTLTPRLGVVEGLPGRKLIVSVARTRFSRTPQAIYLMNGTKRYALRLVASRGAYEAELDFSDTSNGRDDFKLTVEYSRTNRAETSFTTHALPLGAITLPASSNSEPVSITLMMEDGSKVSFPDRAFSNPAASLSYGWMVPNGKYYLAVSYDGKTTTTPVFVVNNNIANQSFTIPADVRLVLRPSHQDAGALTNLFVREVVAPVSVALVMLGVLTQVSLFDILALLRLVFSQPILLISKRKREAWGLVYNSLNKLPVDLAIVRLVDPATSRILQTKVTGKSGRYFFKAAPGTYRLEVIKDGMVFPSQLLMSSKSDGRKTDLYHGAALTITEHYPVINATIPGDPKVEEKTLARLKWERAGRIIQVLLSFFGVGVTGYSLFLAPEKWHLWLLLIIHILVLALFIRLAIPKHPEGWGVVTDTNSQKPLPGVVAKLYNTEYGRPVSYELTDRHGRYYFLAGDSTYQIRFEKSEYKPKTTAEIDVRGKEEENIALNTRLEREDHT